MTREVRQTPGAQRFAFGPSAASIVGSAGIAGATLLIALGIGPAAFGGYMVVLTIALILVTVSLLSLNFVMYQELPRAPKEQQGDLIATALITGLALMALVAAIVLLGTPWLSSVIGVSETTLRLAVALATAIGVNLLGESFLRGRKRFGRAAALKLIMAAIYLAVVCCGLLIWDLHDFASYVLFFAVANLGYGLAALAALDIGPTRFRAPQAAVMLRHGAHVSAIAVLMMMVFSLDIVIVHRFQPPDVVGAYALYNGFPKRLLTVVLTEGIGLVLLPFLATLDKPRLMRRLVGWTPVVWLSATLMSFVASALFFLLLRDEYPYSLSLMALSAAGLGTHAVFNVYFFALSMDGVRGARVLIVSLVVGLPGALAVQVALIRPLGLVGGLAAFLLTNLLLIAIVWIATARVYKTSDAAVPASPHRNPHD